MVVLHVGFPKTGSTFLQSGFFARCPDVRYLGKPYVEPVLGHLVRDICFQDSSDYDEARWRDVWAERDTWAPAARSASGVGPYVISEEGLTFHEVRDSRLCAQRCADLFGEVRVLFTVRSQIDTLVSYFRNHALLNTNCYACKGRERAAVTDWLDYQWRAMEWRYKTYLGNLRYDGVIAQWAEVFGRDRIDVLPFESLRADPESFFADLSERLGVPSLAPPSEDGAHQNRGRTERRLLFERARNRFWEDPTHRLPGDSPADGFPGAETSESSGLGDAFFGFLERGESIRVEIPEEWTARLTGFFAPGNARLANTYALDLDGLGYPV